MRSIADRLGVKLQLQALSGAQRVPALVAGNVDFLSGSMLATPDRAKVIDFIISFYPDQNAILTEKDGPIHSMADLAAPRKIAIAGGGYTGTAILKVQPKADIVSLQGWSDAVQALLTGHADAVVTEGTTLETFLKRAPQAALTIIPAPEFKHDYYAMAVRRNDSRWRLFLDMAIMQAWNDGTIPKLHEKYFGRKPNYEIPVWSTIEDADKVGFWDNR